MPLTGQQNWQRFFWKLSPVLCTVCILNFNGYIRGAVHCVFVLWRSQLQAENERLCMNYGLCRAKGIKCKINSFSEGELTSLDPYTVQLKFEPSGRPGSEDSYYLNFKDNICVVCGSDHSYMRKNIVPHDYRRYFPLVMKDHHSHDVLLMCPECHRISTFYDDKLRRELAIKYNAPLGKAYFCNVLQISNIMT